MSEGLFRVSVRVKPNARRSAVLGYSHDRGVLEIALNAPPRDGEANAELIHVLSEFFQIPKRNLVLVSGFQNREKVVEVEGDADRLIELILNDTQTSAGMKEERSVRYTKSNLPSKICAVCARSFNWRKKWERCWDEVRYCSDRCRNERGV